MIFKKIRQALPQSIKNKYHKLINLKNLIDSIRENQINSWLFQRNPSLRTSEFKIFSQFGEDGVIDFIFKKLGTTNKTFLEFGIETGEECITRNLSENFGWNGLLIEGNKEEFKIAKELYKNKPVKVINEFVTRENINPILRRNKIIGDIDLFYGLNAYFIRKDLTNSKIFKELSFDEAFIKQKGNERYFGKDKDFFALIKHKKFIDV